MAFWRKQRLLMMAWLAVSASSFLALVLLVRKAASTQSHTLTL